MDLTHRFSVPTTLEETWAHFQDVAGLAGCFPGAQVTSVDGDDFTGSCKVKLGPIALVYNGTGTFTERDEAAHRLVVVAKGKDKRGNGTAAATASLTMSEAPAGGTAIEVLTDLAITGKPAQFGRGLIQDVSDKLLGQFVSCLEQQLSQQPVDAGGAEAAAGEPTGPPGPSPVTQQQVSPTDDAPTSVPSVASSTPARPPVRPAPQQVEALDLGAAVLPVLIRSYWKQAAAVLVALALIIRVARR